MTRPEELTLEGGLILIGILLLITLVLAAHDYKEQVREKRIRIQKAEEARLLRLREEEYRKLYAYNYVKSTKR